MAYDRDKLKALGDRHRDLDAELKAVRAEMKPLIIEADADGEAQVEIMRLTGYSGETIRKMCLPPEQAAQEARARKERRRKGVPA